MYTTLISSEALAKHHLDPDWAICDCRFDLSGPARGRSDYLDGHIPQAIYVDLELDLSGTPSGSNGRHPLPSSEKLIDLIESLGIDNETQVVIYDNDGGGYAVRFWWILKYMGHHAVAILDGGIQAWRSAGFDLSKEEQQRSRRSFHAQILEDRLVTVDELLGSLHDQDLLLLDARAPERYLGAEETLDPVAGHIPGAKNRYWRHNLDSQGFFKSKAELSSALKYLLQGRASEDAVIYCGSGVTACHNILAFVQAGFEMPRLYAGSWSEWCSDTSRPFEATLGNESPRSDT